MRNFSCLEELRGTGDTFPPVVVLAARELLIHTGCDVIQDFRPRVQFPWSVEGNPFPTAKTFCDTQHSLGDRELSDILVTEFWFIRLENELAKSDFLGSRLRAIHTREELARTPNSSRIGNYIDDIWCDPSSDMHEMHVVHSQCTISLGLSWFVLDAGTSKVLCCAVDTHLPPAVYIPRI